jgi:hypothetical protein
VQQSNKPLRIEHWDVAINHGRSVANHIVKGDSFEGTTLLSPSLPLPPFPSPSPSPSFVKIIFLILGYTSTTYFWSAQGSQLRYAGTTAIDGFDDVIIQGSTDPKEPKFSAFYIKDNKVIAVMGMGTDPTVSLSAELLYGIPLL